MIKTSFHLIPTFGIKIWFNCCPSTQSSDSKLSSWLRGKQAPCQPNFFSKSRVYGDKAVTVVHHLPQLLPADRPALSSAPHIYYVCIMYLFGGHDQRVPDTSVSPPSTSAGQGERLCPSSLHICHLFRLEQRNDIFLRQILFAINYGKNLLKTDNLDIYQERFTI